MSEHFIWVEKYRPRKIDDCILPESQKEYFKQMVDKGEIQNMLCSWCWPPAPPTSRCPRCCAPLCPKPNPRCISDSAWG